MTPSLYIEFFLTVASVGTAVLNEHSAKGGTYEL